MLQFNANNILCERLLVVVIAVGLGGIVQAEDGRGQVHSMLLNAESVRTFDVLLEIEKSYDITSQDLATQKTYMRLTCDRDRQRFLCTSKAEISRYASEGEPPTKEVATSGFLRDGEVIRVANPIGKVNVVQRPFERLLSANGVPDLRFVGVRGFPSPFYSPEDPVSFDNMLKRILVSKSKYVVNSTAPQNNTIELKAITSEPPGGRVLGRSLEWEVSEDTLMPKSYREYLRWKDGGVVKKTATRWERFEWEEHDGVYVPSMIVSDELGSLNNEQFTIQMTVQLHWISVNTELDDEVFSAVAIESLDAFQKKIDPTLVDTKAKK